MVANFSVESTKELLTARSGLAFLGEYLDRLGFSESVDSMLPRPGSNKGLLPSNYVSSLVMMLHAGGQYLEDVRLLRDDAGLSKLLGFKVPSADAVGDWLRRTGNQAYAMLGLTRVNNDLLCQYFSTHKPGTPLTLDIDATAIESGKQSATYTYKDFKGYMPIVGHVDQFVVGEEFRHGHVAPATNNLEFIKHCLLQMPEKHPITAIRADSASYQAEILNFCYDNKLEYAIGGKITQNVADEIKAISPQEWHAYTDKYGIGTDRQIASMPWSMDKTKQAFTLVIVRSKGLNPNLFTQGDYHYHVVATNISNKTNAEIMQWYSQRGEDSENRIKELKCGFAMEYMPCASFEANAAFFRIGNIAYNLFLLFRNKALDSKWANAQIKTIRLYIYQIPAKIIRKARKLILKTTQAATILFQQLRLNIALRT